MRIFFVQFFFIYSFHFIHHIWLIFQLFLWTKASTFLWHFSNTIFCSIEWRSNRIFSTFLFIIIPSLLISISLNHQLHQYHSSHHFHFSSFSFHFFVHMTTFFFLYPEKINNLFAIATIVSNNSKNERNSIETGEEEGEEVSINKNEHISIKSESNAAHDSQIN